MKNLKILLLSIYNSDTMLLNHDDIGLASIASFVRKNGYDVKFIGCYEDELDYNMITNYAPDLIGLPIFRDSKDSVYRFSEKVKAIFPDVIISIGGSFATFYATEILTECQHIDFVVRGEGERVFLNLIYYSEGNRDIREIDGLTYRCADKIYHNKSESLIENLDSLSYPCRDMLVDNKLKIATISTSRGCYGRCTFCESPNYWIENNRHIWRGREVSSIIDEINEIEKNYGVKRFYIVSNSFEDPGNNHRKVEEFAKKIIDRNLIISYQISIRSIFQRKCTNNLIETLKLSGLCSVFVGVESANINDLKLYGKYSNCEDNIKIIKLLRDNGIYVNIGFININPYSTFENLYSNLEFLTKYNFAGLFLMLSRLRIEKGTELYHKISKDQLWTNENNSYYSGLNYRHVDARVDNLVTFLDDYFNKDEEMYKLLYRILYYERYFLMYLAYNKRLAISYNNIKAKTIIYDCENDINNIFCELNIVCSDWFKNLLHIAETKWDYESATELSKLHLDKHYLFSIDKKLGQIKGKYYKNLVQSGSDCLDYLI